MGQGGLQNWFDPATRLNTLVMGFSQIQLFPKVRGFHSASNVSRAHIIPHLPKNADRKAGGEETGGGRETQREKEREGETTTERSYIIKA